MIKKVSQIYRLGRKIFLRGEKYGAELINLESEKREIGNHHRYVLERLGNLMPIQLELMEGERYELESRINKVKELRKINSRRNLELRRYFGLEGPIIGLHYLGAGLEKKAEEERKVRKWMEKNSRVIPNDSGV